MNARRSAGALLELLDRIDSTAGDPVRIHTETIRMGLRRVTLCCDLRQLRCKPPSIADDPRKNVERARRACAHVVAHVAKETGRKSPAAVRDIVRAFDIIEEAVRPIGEAWDANRRALRKARAASSRQGQTPPRRASKPASAPALPLPPSP